MGVEYNVIIKLTLHSTIDYRFFIININ